MAKILRLSNFAVETAPVMGSGGKPRCKATTVDRDGAPIKAVLSGCAKRRSPQGLVSLAAKQAEGVKISDAEGWAGVSEAKNSDSVSGLRVAELLMRQHNLAEVVIEEDAAEEVAPEEVAPEEVAPTTTAPAAPTATAPAPARGNGRISH